MTSSETTTPPVELPEAGRYDIDPGRTSVAFRTRHMFGLGGVKGGFTLRTAELVIGDPSATTTVHAVIDAASFNTGNASRDATVRSAKYLDVTNFADITFDCDNVHQRDGHWVGSGQVTAHGVAAPTDVTLQQVDGTDELVLRASATIDRYAHGVTAGKGMTGRWLQIEISAVARKRLT